MKIISGAQTGVDRAALDWAMQHGLPHGGWCPQGRTAQDGVIPERYQLQETPSSGYSQRTRQNIETADATLLIHTGPLIGGSELTQRLARKLNKPLAVFDLNQPWPEQAKTTRQWLDSHAVGVLNVAGPSEDRHPGIYALTMQALDMVFSSQIK
jgi:hypothetical protein